MRPLSYSQISTYQKCPLLYKLQYIEGLKPKERPYFSFGTTVHSAVEYFYRGKVPTPPSLENLIANYDVNWVSEGYASPEEEAKYRELGRKILTAFWETNSADFRLPVATEYHFFVDIDGVRLQGYIDRVDKLDNNKLSIVDYKTSQKLFTRDDLRQDFQLTLYQVAAEMLWGLPVDKLTLYHLRSNTPCTCPARDKVQIEEARYTVVSVAESIARGLFEPAENAYCPCDFPEFCPYHKAECNPPKAKVGETATGKGLAVPEAIDRYVEIQSRIKELELELEEIKAQLIAFCAGEGLARLYSPNYQLTVRKIERLGFSEDEVRTLLEPIGLWSKVLGYNETLVKQFLEGSEITAPIRRELEKLRKVKSSYPQIYVKKVREEE